MDPEQRQNILDELRTLSKQVETPERNARMQELAEAIGTTELAFPDDESPEPRPN